jgi:hemerythrin-like domain-containing protein
MNEHKNILIGLDILEKMAFMARQQEHVEISDVQNIIDFFHIYADKCHHGKEEDLLFPVMEANGIERENGPIGYMLIDHVNGRKYIAQMAASIQNNRINKEEFVKAALDYVKMLRMHIHKEDVGLFPTGDKMMPIDQQNILAEKFKNHEKNVIGIDTINGELRILNELKSKYLK